jgi:hypothetical protein
VQAKDWPNGTPSLRRFMVAYYELKEDPNLAEADRGIEQTSTGSVKGTGGSAQAFETFLDGHALPGEL